MTHPYIIIQQKGKKQKNKQLFLIHLIQGIEEHDRRV